jgi:BirA family transcriptional regulator, biotin operon repressor / biotin---[acetyl-CoA-carboxylase] ligase
MKADLQACLADLPLGGLCYFDSIGSTNDYAIQWAQAGAADFSLVVADHQTAGRGRFKRQWFTYPGTALAFSLILRPQPAELNFLSLFAALGAVAILQALQDLYGLLSEIKWPNDILLERRKVAGILVENSWLGNQLQSIVIGIGMNITSQAVPPAEEVMFPASCLETVLGRSVDRWEVLNSILSHLKNDRERLNSNELIKIWEGHLAFKNEWVHLSRSEHPDRVGRVIGLTAFGNLRLVDENGVEWSAISGDVHIG